MFLYTGDKVHGRELRKYDGQRATAAEKIERLQRKMKNPTEAYNQKTQEVNELKNAVQPKERSRIRIASDKKLLKSILPGISFAIV